MPQEEEDEVKHLMTEADSNNVSQPYRWLLFTRLELCIASETQLLVRSDTGCLFSNRSTRSYLSLYMQMVIKYLSRTGSFLPTSICGSRSETQIQVGEMWYRLRLLCLKGRHICGKVATVSLQFPVCRLFPTSTRQCWSR